MIRTAVIGYGLGGMAFHAPLVNAVPELELAAICTSRPDPVHERYPGMRVVDADTAIDDPGIALIVISTPNDSHYPRAKQALLAGKHVVIDKPFTNAASEGEELIAIARERGLVLSAFHNRRWDGDFQTVKKLLDSGALGEMMLYEAHWDRWRPEVTNAWRDIPEAGSGMLADLGPHLIDQLLLLMGMPEALTADISFQREGARTNDYFHLTFHYGKRRAILAGSRLIAAPRPRFQLNGTKASFVKYGLDPQEPVMKAGGTPDTPGYGVEDAEWHGALVLPDGSRETVVTERGDYRNYYSGIGRAIAEGTPPPVTAEDAVLGQRIIELAWRSAEEGRRLSL
jgi:scyllo-inositol 2-dehydrogenase (NADP+)